MALKCIWVNKKSEPCPWNCNDGKIFCKRHSVYEGIYTKEDIPLLNKCSGCKNLFKFENNEKICVKCNERCKNNRKKTKEINLLTLKKCMGITNNGTPCTYQCKENDNYCEKHQSYKKMKEIIDSGKNICKNWIRGCFAEIELDKKSCIECRKKEQDNENKSNEAKKIKAIEYNILNDKLNMCYICNLICENDKIQNNKCPKCYDTYKKCETNRGPRDVLLQKLSYSKKSAKNRNIEWKLTDDEALLMIQSKCNYCDKLVSFNGIDRIDNNKDYTTDNCVACCKYCNIMKSTYSENKFLKIVKYILSKNLKIDEDSNEKHSKYFEVATHNTYNRFILDANTQNKNVEINEDRYNKITSLPCHYCLNTFEKGAKGIDRINSSIGYIINNIKPCCKTCNMFKNDLSYDDFFNHLLNIYNFKILNVKNNELTIQEQIISLCKNIKPMKSEKFFHEKEYYENLIFNYNDIEQVKKIKIYLEFAENKNQQDIWNYYRRNISSLKKIENAHLIGRQIYILIKDNTTEKYLGIISLSSDIYNIEDRDNYIGWNSNDKINQLVNIANMSTCVPTSIFGFNFNGGKLLASLVFSKEVLEYYKNKYNNNLLGITTTSLYGKSIMYDRLKCFKFCGYTKGNSVKNIPSEVTKICSDYLKTEYNKNYPLRKKFIIIQSAFDKLGLPKEDLIMDNKKGVYFGFTYKKSQKYLQNKINNLNTDVKFNDIKTSEEIFNWWLNRWATQRFNHLQSLKNINNINNTNK